MLSDELSTLKVDYYVDSRCREPVTEWLSSLDRSVRVRVEVRINRLRLGQLGDFKALGKELFELKMDFGPGYRIYFGYLSEKWVLLLTGGDKSSQEKDILKAKKYWDEYLKRVRRKQ